ncbi:protein of unknown function [Thauera humireducens]|nr:protein of unknown function [Thauera humireducens]
MAPWRCRVSTRLEGQTMSTQSAASTAIPKLLASADVALIIGKSEITIKNWIYRRKPFPPDFPRPFKIGSEWRWRLSDLERYIDLLATQAIRDAEAEERLMETRRSRRRLC